MTPVAARLSPVTPSELERAVKRGVWDSVGRKLSSESVRAEAARAGVTLPDEVATFLGWVNGGVASAGREVFFFDVPDFLDFDSQGEGRLPEEGWFLACDSGQGAYFYDPTGKVTGTVGSVVWADRTNLAPRDTVPVADGLVEFLRVVTHSKESFEFGKTLRDRAIERMKDTIARVAPEGGEGLSFPWREFLLPLELRGMLEVRNGLTLTPRVRCLCQDELELAEDPSGEAVGVWMGEGPRERYLVTYERAPWEEGQLLRVRTGQGLDEAEDLGWMPAVVADLLEGKRKLG